MQEPRPGLGALWRRAAVLPALLFLLVAGYGVALAVLAALHPVPPVGPGAGFDRGEVWKASYSRRFPGCVALVLWPHGEEPRAVLVRAPDGRLGTVTPAVAAGGLHRGDGSVRGSVVGACR